MSIKIPVEAQFDQGNIDAQLSQFSQKLNAMGKQIASLNKAKFEPIGKTSLDDMRKMQAQFEALKRVSGDLNRRVNATGQKGAAFHELNWEAMYPNQHSRARQQTAAWQYITGGAGFGGRMPQQPMPNNPQQQGVGGWMANNVFRPGLNQAGGVGQAASGALGTGMRAGVGAGLAGLLGGIVALGVGKAVGAATEKMGEAEDNAVAYDKLKRMIGDVNVSFEALKTSVGGVAKANNITYAEATKLSTEYAKQSGLIGDQYKEAMLPGGGLGVGIGMSRAFGLDPSAGVGALGSVRGVGAAKNEQETRRFALLIGETIGKSGAFAKADEVMGAITDYTVSQTRQNLSAANGSGYAGMLAGMIGSGIPGLDPTGASGLLSRINSSLTAGGANGEASQFFTSQVGRAMGLDSIQTQFMREHGAFATNNSTFGEDSVWARFMGKEGPTGTQTHLSAQLEMLNEKYGHDKGLLAQATANHFGTNMSQAMAMHLVSPAQMDEMSKYGDIKNLNGESIAGMGKALFGSADDRAKLANDLHRRTGDDKLSEEEIARLDSVFKLSGEEGAKAQGKALAEMLATRGQEDTQGKDIRDSKVQLDNIKTAISDRLIPLTQTMRDGILSIAGVGKNGATREDILGSMIEAEHGGRISGYKKTYNEQYSALEQQRIALDSDSDWEMFDSEGERKARAEKRAQIVAERDKLTADYNKKVEEQNALMDKELAQMRDSLESERKLQQDKKDAEQKLIDAETKQSAKREQESQIGDRYTASGADGVGAGAGMGNGMGKVSPALQDIGTAEEQRNVQAFLETIAKSEGAGYNTLVGKGSFNDEIQDLSRHPNKVGLVTGDGPSTAAGKYQITGTTWRSLKHKGNASFSPENQDAAAIELIKRRGALEHVKAGNWAAAVPKLGDEWQSLPSGTSKHQGKRSWSQFNKYMAESMASVGTPLPDGGSNAGAQQQSVAFDPINVNIMHTNPRGEQVRPPESLQTRPKTNYYARAN